MPKDRMTPFLVRLGEAIPETPPAQLAYDSQHQLVRVLVDGHWQDAADCSDGILGGVSRITRVARETTDDE